MAAMTNASDTAGPAMLPAVRAVTVKMPAPTTTATPKTMRSLVVSSRLSWCSGSKVSWMESSMLLRPARPNLCSRVLTARTSWG